MRIGYAKEMSKSIGNKLADTLNAERMFIDKPGEDDSLHDAVEYSRPGDVIVVRSIREISLTAGGFVDFVLQVRKVGVDVHCKEEGVDTSNFMWTHLVDVLAVYDKNYSSVEKDRPNLYIELDQYFNLVETGEITVQAVCDKLQIGKSTYYRRWRQVKKKPESRERHPERFEEYARQVQRGEITVAEACKRMGIGVTTYYRMKKKQ